MSDFDQKNGSHSQNNQQNQVSGSYEADSTGQGPYPSYTKKGKNKAWTALPLENKGSLTIDLQNL